MTTQSASRSKTKKVDNWTFAFASLGLLSVGVGTHMVLGFGGTMIFAGVISFTIALYLNDTKGKA